MEQDLRKKIELLETKLQNARRSNEELDEKLSEACQTSSRLASSMGFESVVDAQAAIAERPHVFDRVNIELAASRIEALQLQLEQSSRLNRSMQAEVVESRGRVGVLRNENEDLQAELSVTRNEVRELRARVEELESVQHEQDIQLARERATPAVIAQSTKSSKAAASVSTVNEQIQRDERIRLAALEKKYARLLEFKDRSAATYKSRYNEWASLKHYLINEFKKLPKPEDAPLEGEDLQRQYISVMSAFKKMLQESVKGDEKLEKTRRMTPPTTDQAVPSTSSAPRLEIAGSPFTVHVDNATPLTQAPPPSSPSPLAVVKSPLKSKQTNIVRAPSPSLSSPRKGPVKRNYEEMADDSDTEDDSQAPSASAKTQPGMVYVTPMEAERIRLGLVPTGLLSPALTTSGSAVPPNTSSSDENAAETEVPVRARTKPLPRQFAQKASNGPLTTPKTRASEAGKENAGSTSTPKQYPKDYSIYKGRGRYAAAAQAATTTINSKYQIDSAQNDGRDFQFDEVVRNKRQRKQLPAGDCEECRAYYDAIGPLPPRLQAPLWRSPESTPTKPRRCTHQRASKASSSTAEAESQDGCAGDTDEVAKHKQRISRHRARWTRAQTPPDYWLINFPTTQEVDDINRRADDIHAHQEKMIEEEASRGGKYKKR